MYSQLRSLSLAALTGLSAVMLSFDKAVAEPPVPPAKDGLGAIVEDPKDVPRESREKAKEARRDAREAIRESAERLVSRAASLAD